VEAALEMWSDFPVDASPRPLLVLPGRHIVDPMYGFRDSELKCAYLDGAFVPPATFPAGPSTAEGYRIISPAEAFATLKAAGDGQGSDTTLQVTEIRLESATFETDRGPKLLPAWLVSLQDVQNPAAVLAIAPGSQFLTPEVVDFHGIGGARLGADPTRLRVVFSGDEPLHAPPPEYAAEVAESETAVAVTIRATTPRLGAIGVADAREIEVTLRVPFGARVLVDGRSGAPRPVISS
jgi:hypothetical protein